MFPSRNHVLRLDKSRGIDFYLPGKCTIHLKKVLYILAADALAKKAIKSQKFLPAKVFDKVPIGFQRCFDVMTPTLSTLKKESTKANVMINLI